MVANTFTAFLTGVPAATRRAFLALKKTVDEQRADIDEITSGSSTVDHGALQGLGDDDHGLYALADGTRGNFEVAGAVTAHEAAGDPHTQYMTPASVDTVTNKTLDSFTNTVNADDLHIQVRNDSGAMIPKGTPVYASGFNLGLSLVLVAPADASSEATMSAIGLIDADLPNNATGAVDRIGRIAGLNTTAWAVGDLLYVSETAGQLTNVRPAAPAISQIVAEVMRSHPTLGVLDVAPIAALIPASETAVGGVELATSAEAIAGTDTMRVVTPVGLSAALDVHVLDTTDAHDASAISYDGSGNGPLIGAWLTATDLQGAIGDVAAQLYSPTDEELEALIAALNALVSDEEITNPDLFASDLIVARHLAAGSITTVKLDAYAVTADKLSVNALQSQNYAATYEVYGATQSSLCYQGEYIDIDTTTGWTFTDIDVGARITAYGAGSGGTDYVGTVTEVRDYGLPPTEPGDGIIRVRVTPSFAPYDGLATVSRMRPVAGFTEDGSFFDLANGDLMTPGLFVDGATGDVSVRGSIVANEFEARDSAGVPVLRFVSDLGDTQSDHMLEFLGDGVGLGTAALSWDMTAGTADPGLLIDYAAPNGLDRAFLTVKESSFYDGTMVAKIEAQRKASTAPMDFTEFAYMQPSAEVGDARVAFRTSQYEANSPDLETYFNMVSSRSFGASLINGSADELDLLGHDVATWRSTGIVNLTAPTINLNGIVQASDKILVGDDAYIEDVDVAHTMAIRSQTDLSIGYLRLGSSMKLEGYGNAYGAIGSPGDMYYDASIHYFRSNGLVNRGIWASDGLHLYGGGAFRQYGNNPFFFQSWGGGWYMMDSTWVRSYADKGLWMGNGSVGTTAQVLAGSSTPASTVLKVWAHRDVYSHGEQWNNSHIVLRNGASVAYTQQAFWTFNVAPMIKVHYQQERFEFQNSGGSAYIPIAASAFVVSSTLRSKTDVEHLADDELLGKVKQVKSIRFRQKVRPQILRATERFKDVDARWQAKGHKPLARTAEHVESHDHDCALDECEGTAESPCVAILNDTPVVGLAAEEVFKVFPEMVDLDSEGLPAGVDVAQVAGTALAAVGALTAKVEALEARIASLESKK